MEGTHCFNPGSNCNDGSLVLPILEYSHADGCSVTGGYRYRGTEMPEHFGKYFYGDFCSGRIWGGVENVETGAWTVTELLDSDLSISTFAEDEQGELYVADYAGTLYRIHGETFCSVQLDRLRYRGGDTVRATRLEIANLSTASVAVEIQIWPPTPRTESISLSRGGADGSIVLPPNYSVDSGPTNLFTLAAGAAPGDYVFGCRFLDPASGALRAEDLTRFKVE
jgi:hypothetical protein